MSPVCFEFLPRFGKVHCCSVLLFFSQTVIYSVAAAHTVGCRYSVGFIVTFLMDTKLSTRFPSILSVAPSANRKWQGWQASECGQFSREPNVTPNPVKSLFRAVIMRFMLSNEAWWCVESIKALSLLIWAFCCLYYCRRSSLAHTDILCTCCEYSVIIPCSPLGTKTSLGGIFEQYFFIISQLNPWN